MGKRKNHVNCRTRRAGMSESGWKLGFKSFRGRRNCPQREPRPTDMDHLDPFDHYTAAHTCACTCQLYRSRVGVHVQNKQGGGDKKKKGGGKKKKKKKKKK